MKKAIIAFLLMSSFTAFAQTKTDTITVDSTKFTVDPGYIEATIYEGEKDKKFTFKIVPVTDMNLHSYGFTVFGYGNGFPTYGVLTDIASGGASGIVYITGTFSSEVFKLDKPDQPKVFMAKLPIRIYHGSASRFNQQFLYLPIKLTVIPKKK